MIIKTGGKLLLDPLGLGGVDRVQRGNSLAK